jgi:cell division protein FtsL
MWPALWMSGVMALAVLLSGFFAQNLPLLILLIVQILCGIGVYSVLIIFNQKELITEVKSMIWNRKLFVAKE